MNEGSIRRVAVVGGGTSGYFAALALKRRIPGLDVTVIESPDVPIIGVGEATTTLMPPFLHATLGIDAVEMFEEVRPTWKLGIRFDWGLPGDYFFTYPFGQTNPLEAWALDGDLRAQSLTSMLMATDRSPLIREPDGSVTSLLPGLKFAYHLDNAPFVRFLARHADRLGVHHVAATIARVVKTADGGSVDRLVLADGRELAFDLYVDASGFRSLLLEGTLGSPFDSWKSSLFCDTAVVAHVPNHGVCRPYTQAETMDAGWCWRIGVEAQDHRGYVFSSDFQSVDAAEAEMRAKNPGMGDPWVVRFRSGRHRDFWKGNVVAVGNAYGFVEPLESTALHMVIVEIAYVVNGLQAVASGRPMEREAAFASERVGAHWDYLRWFLALHHKYNRRLDTPFWKASRADVDVSGLSEEIARFRAEGPWRQDGTHFRVGDPAFGYEGMMIMLLGQQVPAPTAPARVSREAWAARQAAQRAVVDRAIPQIEALALLRTRPDLIRAFADAPDSWCRLGAEAIEQHVASAAGAHPVEDRARAAAPGPYDALLRIMS